jgi:hypothetical protein
MINFGFAGSLHGVNLLALAYNLIKVTIRDSRWLCSVIFLPMLFVWGYSEFPPNHLPSPTSDPKGGWHHV